MSVLFHFRHGSLAQYLHLEQLHQLEGRKDRIEDEELERLPEEEFDRIGNEAPRESGRRREITSGTSPVPVGHGDALEPGATEALLGAVLLLGSVN